MFVDWRCKIRREKKLVGYREHGSRSVFWVFTEGHLIAEEFGMPFAEYRRVS